MQVVVLGGNSVMLSACFYWWGCGHSRVSCSENPASKLEKTDFDCE